MESIGLLSTIGPLYATAAALLALGFVIGIVAVVAGVGGGVMFVPLAAALFPIHVDFIRGAGLMVALVGAVAAAPILMERRLSRIRLAVPLALAGSVGSIVGARVGLMVPDRAIMTVLAVLMIFIAVQTAVTGLRARRSAADRRRTEPPDGDARSISDRVAAAWVLHGVYRDPATGEEAPWRARHIVPAIGLFVGIGVIGGALGVGAGWANVPVLASLVGLPLKMAAATSGLIIVANSSAAAWVYLREGALDALVVIPAVAGMIGGTRIGARILGSARPGAVRALVVLVLVAAGVRTLVGVLE